MSTYAFNDKLEREKIAVISGMATTAAGKTNTMTFDASKLAEFGVDANYLGDYAIIGAEYAVSSVGGSAPTLWSTGRVIQVQGLDVCLPYITKDADNKQISVTVYNEDSSTMRLFVRVYLIKVA
jgi:hypothetical protein